MRYRQIVAGILMSACAGCASLPFMPAPQAKTPATIQELKGVGVDYNWSTQDHDRLCRELTVAGNNATSIEFMGWSGATDGYANGADSLEKPYKSLLKAARKYNVTVFVSALNDNLGQGKYLDRHKPLSAYAAQCERALQIILENGPQNIIVQVVSETQTSYGRSLEVKWVPRFNAAGFKTCCNDGARTARPKHGEHYSAWHTCDVNDPGPANTIRIPDCGKPISVYTQGGWPGADLKPDVCARYVAKGGNIIYGFVGLKTIPSETIKAVGKSR